MANSLETNHQASRVASSEGSTSDLTKSRVRKRRGKFKGLETLKKMRGYNNVKLHVQIDMEFRRPYGENTDGLVDEISRLVTLCASFDVPYWRDVPEVKKVKIYEKLLDKFELKVGNEVRDDIYVREIINEIASRRYRHVRSILYRRYQSFATDEERLQNPPEDINVNEWAWLVNYFGSKKFKAMSERNKTNRSKHMISHVTRRRSFKQVSWAERNEEGESSAHELWILTHQKKDDSWGSEQSRQVYETVKDKLEEIGLHSGDAQLTTSEEVLSSVVGQRSGRVRGRGCGPRPPSKSVITAAEIVGLKAQIQQKDEIILQMREEMAQIQEKLIRQKEEVTAEVTACLQSGVSSQVNELMNQKFIEMMSQIRHNFGP